MTPMRSLERFALAAKKARQGARCEVCTEPIGEGHRHVVDRTARRLLCACASCTLAFDGDQPARFRTVPDRVRVDPAWALSERDLQELGVPVGLAFFFRASTTGRWTAVFPSPAGPTEAELEDDAWARFAGESALVRSMADDVEALLIHRRRDGRSFCLVVPIDACYELAALLKRTWRGIDGGDDARAALDAFFTRLAERSELLATDSDVTEGGAA